MKNLETLIERLSGLQSSLHGEHHNEEILRNKFLNAVRNVESCKLPCYKPADTVQGVILDIHASLSTRSGGITGV